MVRTNVHDANSTCMKFAEHQQTMNDLEFCPGCCIAPHGRRDTGPKIQVTKSEMRIAKWHWERYRQFERERKDDSSAERAAQFAKYNIGNDLEL